MDTVIKTPGTNLKWEGLAGWIRIYHTIESRRCSYTTYEQLGEHRKLLTKELINTCNDIEILRHIEGHEELRRSFFSDSGTTYGHQWWGEIRCYAHNRLYMLMRQCRWHRNLNAKPPYAWSYSWMGEPMRQAKWIYSQNVTIKQPSGNSFEQCLAGGKRAVFAWFKCEWVLTDEDVAVPNFNKLTRVRFNPKQGDENFYTSLHGKVDKLTEAYGTPDGECWAVV